MKYKPTWKQQVKAANNKVMIKKISTGDLQNQLSLNCYFGITDIPKKYQF